MGLHHETGRIGLKRGVALLALSLAMSVVVVSPPSLPVAASAASCSATSIGVVPLIDGEGLYENANTMPDSHAVAAPEITPNNGIVGVASLGMSNGSQEWEAFMELAGGVDVLSPSVRFANGAVSGKTISAWADPSDSAWSIALSRIESDGLSAGQVQIVWMKMGSQLPELSGSRSQRIAAERDWLDATIANAAMVFPNLVRIYISSRIYAGYNSSQNHNEPETGFDNGLSVKAIVADSVAGKTAVWTAWGPYLWADGTTPRSDGLTWECSDFQSDGVHPSARGEEKVAGLLASFFSSDESACGWFLADPSGCGAPTPSPCADVGCSADQRFNDVPATHLFFADIEWLASERITLGCNPPANTDYCPDARVTRGQMAAFLDRALALADGPDAFVDDDGTVFEANINALAAAGITKGCNPPTNNRYCPGSSVTRGQMAAFLGRALDLPAGVGDTFVDDDTSIFESNIEALAASGITKGCNPPVNDKFCPTAPVTRGQMAAFLHRAAPLFGS
jgi:hypothetical protein